MEAAVWTGFCCPPPDELEEVEPAALLDPDDGVEAGPLGRGFAVRGGEACEEPVGLERTLELEGVLEPRSGATA